MDEEIDGQERVRDLLDVQLRRDFKHIFGRLVALGRKKGLSLQEAEDLAGQTLLRALQRRDRYSPVAGKPVLAWLTTLAKNLFIDLLRQNQRDPAACAEDLSPATEVDPAALPDTQAVGDRAAAMRRVLLANLSREDHRFLTTWIPQHHKEIDRDEAANRLGMTVEEYEAAKKRMKTVLARVLKELGLKPSDLWSPEKDVRKIAQGARKEKSE
jgi:DNA-directed RNA polymerase specialized sigma24 family protein